MTLVKTAHDLGFAVRARRKHLGWDQARLAREIGVSRQWIVDIEKGKARAEFGLVLRAIYALGLSLHVDRAADTAATPPPSDASRSSTVSLPDIDHIVDRYRALSSAAQAAKSLQASLPDLRELMRQQSAATQAAKELHAGLPGLQELMREQNAAVQTAKELHSGLPGLQELIREQSAAAQAAKELHSRLPDFHELLREQSAAAQTAKDLHSSLPSLQELVRDQSAAAQIANYLQSSVPDDLRELMRKQNATAESASPEVHRASAPSGSPGATASATGKKRKSTKRLSNEKPG